ncbi:archaetidylserine decarboxylase [Beggiatoa leptomitoformis]|uniref:Phosphatidylserine decarboxylase proenzyme n=1 Tax=Beggiatoa leptomitoformis TaxID=288004 RepID=A0A2N9YCL2_9GAMM|nr:archaetidylserine decarboxylase [Beggiatoa leptomitoformis]ALG66496.1 phosphatidylserine decarboxylase [Beggiatoa leptomitoformis]AUI68211.1 phosphatidylserine decarboxylase [Beggiatoa leptomitoformis]
MLKASSFTDKFKTLPQYVIPQHFLSRLMCAVTRWKGGKVTHWIIRQFIRHYHVDMQVAALSKPTDYNSFNAFFTRALCADARPIADGIVSPVDGVISQLGMIKNNQILQAKGHDFSLTALLGGSTHLSTYFNNGLFCTIYLSPKDYHRIHSPITGQVREMIYVPGKLFSVNKRTTTVVPQLFARNERLICILETAIGKVAVIFVGALFVGSMETKWAGTITPPYQGKVQSWQYLSNELSLQCGEEMGRFNMGSTVILLLPPDKAHWLSQHAPDTALLMGQALAQLAT